MPFRIIRAEPEDWEAVRSIRLRSLGEEPQAYAADYETEARYRPRTVAGAAGYCVQLSGIR
jgi:hypothetical protein